MSCRPWVAHTALRLAHSDTTEICAGHLAPAVGVRDYHAHEWAGQLRGHFCTSIDSFVAVHSSEYQQDVHKIRPLACSTVGPQTALRRAARECGAAGIVTIRLSCGAFASVDTARRHAHVFLEGLLLRQLPVHNMQSCSRE